MPDIATYHAIATMTPDEARAALAALPSVHAQVVEYIVQFHPSQDEEDKARNAYQLYRDLLSQRAGEKS